MKTFAKFDSEGFPAGFWNEEVHGPKQLPIFGAAEVIGQDEEGQDIFGEPPVIDYVDNPNCLIPADAEEITHEQWLEFINNSGLRKMVDGEIVEYEPPPPPPPQEMTPEQKLAAIGLTREDLLALLAN